MAILGKLLNTGRNALLIALAAASVAYGQQMPLENELMQNPELNKVFETKKSPGQEFAELCFMFQSRVTNPYDSFESNAKAWQLSNSIIDYLIAGISKNHNLEKTVSGRAIMAALEYESNAQTCVVSHEIAHYIGLRRAYPDAEICFGYPVLYANGAIFLQMSYPEIPRGILTKNKLFHIVSGLNMNEYDAHVSAESSAFEIDYKHALSYLHGKLQDQFYSIGDFFMPHPRSDLAGFTNIIMKTLNRIKETREQLAFQLLLPDILSFRAYDSVRAISNFIKTGQPSIIATHLDIGNVKISPPEISSYLTLKGMVYNASIMVSDEKNTIYTLQFASEKICPKPTNFKDTRIGIGIRNPGNTAAFECAVTFDESRKPRASFSFTKTVMFDNGEIDACIGYSSKDLMENAVKGKPNGLEITLSASISF